MIKPTIGRVVWYYGPNHQIGDQPFAAIVCFVHDDAKVNLSVFNAEGMQKPKLEIDLIQENEQKPSDVGYCTWMPYQIGQAKKEEK